MSQNYDKQTKDRIKAFMRDKNTAIVPEDVTKYIFRHMTQEDATSILEEMVRVDNRIEKEMLQDGSYVYFYKYKKKKRYY